MKTSGFKFYFCISLQAVLLLILLLFLPNPIWEHLHPKSVTSKTEGKELSLTKSEHASVELASTFSLLTVADSDASIEALSTSPPKTLQPRTMQNRRTTSKTKASVRTPGKDLLTKQSRPARTAFGRWKGRPANVTTAAPLQAINFTAEPEWEIEEDYTMSTSASETSCPISVKIKALNSSWLKEKFIPRITIFMDKRHFSDGDWARLRHFIPPYGWMELSYDVIQEVVSALPRIPDQQLLLAEKGKDKVPNCVSCAVVGNGGILNASSLGKEIDAHDYVFRVNGAVIKGHEKDVGVRTSFYGFTAFTMLSSLYLLHKEGFPTIPKDKETKYILFTEGLRDYEWLKALQQNKEISRNTLEQYRLRPRDDFGANFDFNRLLVAHPDFIRYLKNRFLRSTTLSGKYWNLYRPSTGALVLLTALHLCDTVSAYGFMTEDYLRYSDHYYDKKKTNLTLFINHDFLMEKDLWARLHYENIIKLYQKT